MSIDATGLIIITLVCGLLGFAVGWSGGYADGHYKGAVAERWACKDICEQVVKRLNLYGPDCDFAHGAQDYVEALGEYIRKKLK